MFKFILIFQVYLAVFTHFDNKSKFYIKAFYVGFTNVILKLA